MISGEVGCKIRHPEQMEDTFELKGVDISWCLTPFNLQWNLGNG